MNDSKQGKSYSQKQLPQRKIYSVPRETLEKNELALKTGEYYLFTNEEVVTLFRELKDSEIGVLIYLITMNYVEKPSTVSAAKIASDLELSTQSVYSALKVLSEKELLPNWFVHKVFVKGNTELRIRNRMKAELGGAVEVPTLVGRIDLLTATEIIEIKNIDEWKEALGKLLAYSSTFPKHAKRIHLFRKSDSSKLATARATCKKFDITRTFEEV